MENKEIYAYNILMGPGEFFKKNPKVALAFSGGTDSAYLLSEAVRAGADVRAYCVRSEFQPDFEFADAAKVAEFLGADMVQLRISVLDDDMIASNPVNRCYYCKRRIFSAIAEAASDDGYDLIIDGTNASDDADDRPGMQALCELGVKSPLRECGITKDEIREKARAAGLDIWDKPAYACLATRIPFGERITEARLRGTEEAEGILHDMGFRDFRVRWRDSDALVQLKADQLDEAMNRKDEIVTALCRIYDVIEIDENPR